MARTRAETAAQKGLPSPASKDEGIPQKRGRFEEQRATKRTKRDHLRSSTIGEAPSRKHLSARVQSTGRKRKQSIENVLEPSLGSDPERQQTSRTHVAEDAFRGPEVCGDNPRQTDPIAFWTEEGRWPEEQCWPEETSEMDPAVERRLARKKYSFDLSRERSSSAISMTPSDQRPREEKSAPYRDWRYPLLLQTKGSYMDISELGILDTSKRLVQDLLSGEQSVPNETLFDDDIFENVCRNLADRNEARIIRDISRLIVPSAESLALRAKDLRHLTESVDEGWNNSAPLTGTRPQPDYSVGFRREAFTEDQLTKLSPFIGDFIAGDQSLFMATYYMYFPFLTCEVEYGVGLDVADRQNAHSMTLAVRAIVELFRSVKREGEVHRRILSFSISHDHKAVRIYGHYPVIDGEDTKYYRHPIHDFSFKALDGREKWTAYRFTKNVYDIWMPTHFKMICSAIDQLPSNLDFDVASLSKTGHSQHLSQHLSRSDADSVLLSVERDNRSNNTR
ncbi:putative unnamed protein product [Rosellinia necatrix]|uniref:Putative unnamed protein product n=1 Tax=Rosellinia necatrix TaxID=77044 RepID=A0A1W2TTC0_ROSNE|nr:putative unnamed protein product [Rosellinia necatrix]